MGRRWVARRLGEVPYRDLWDYRMPASYAMAGVLVRVLGPVAARCRLAMMGLDLGTVLLVYYFVRQWRNRTEACAAAAICGFFGGAIRVQGDCLTPDHPMTLCIVLAMVAALHSKGRRSTWVALSGLACGAAICFRAVAALHVAALMVWLAASNGGEEGGLRGRLARPAVMLIAAALPLACCVAYFRYVGAFEDFWRSVVVHGFRYRTPLFEWYYIRRSLRVAWALAPEQAGLWLFAGGWALHAFSQGFTRETGLVVLWGTVAVAATLLARQPSSSHFLQTVPPLAIGAGLAVTNPSERFLVRDAQGRIETRSAMLAVFALVLAAGFLYTERRAYAERAARGELSTDRAAAEVATLIRRRTSQRDRIYVWGTRPQIYVIAKRGAAHPAFYNRELNIDRDPQRQPAFFDPGVYEDIFVALTRERPPFVVTTEQYLPEKIESLGPIAPWFYYMREHYELWRIVDAKPYAFTIFARKDRVYDK